MGNAFWTESGNQWEFHGLFDHSVHYVEQMQLLRTDLWKRFVEQFRFDSDYDAGWRCEYWGKMMRGACFVYEYSRNPALYKTLTETIEDILTTQDENGRITSYSLNHEFDGWDLWGRKYVLLGLQYFLEICTDDALKSRIVRSMCQQVDYIIQKIGPSEEGKIPITKATRHWRGLNSSSILEPIVRLYRLTKNQRYFDFAQYIMDCGGTDIVNIFELAYLDQFYPYQYPVTKAYEMISCFEGLLELYDVTGKAWYRTAVINYANKILESDFTVIGSSGCTNEFFDHSTVRQANTNLDSTMQETCVTVTLMKFFYRLNLLTGDAKYADAFEISFYNAYLGAINTEQVIEPMIPREYPDWEAEPLPFDSYSPLTAGTRGNGIGGLKVMRDNHYYGCCACIGAAGLGLVPKISVLHDKNAVVVNMYFDGTILTKTPNGQKLLISTSTIYPVGESIHMTMEIERTEKFLLRFRIPGWSRMHGLTVQGQPLPQSGQIGNGYIEVERTWHNGDVITLSFDMRTEILRPALYDHQILMNKVIWGANYMIPTFDGGDPLAQNHFALRRGPVMLAQENRLGYSVDDPIALPAEEDGCARVSFPEKKIAPFPNIIELEVTLSDGSKIHVTDYASAGKLWTEESKMAVWMLTKRH